MADSRSSDSHALHALMKHEFMDRVLPEIFRS